MLLLKLQIFLKSLFFHVQAGLPKSSQEQINQRYSICLLCDQFNKIKSECSVCGCAISKKKKFLNKLAWSDQECPLGKWNKLI
jgi:hypothetical protein